MMGGRWFYELERGLELETKDGSQELMALEIGMVLGVCY